MKPFKFLLLVLIFLVSFSPIIGQKLSRDERAKLTPEQRIVYENSRHRKVNRNKQESVQKKVAKAKKEDRASRRIKAPKRLRKSKPKK